MPRARWLEVLQDYVVHSYSVEEQRIDRSGDVAAVLSKVYMRATVLGEDRSGLFVISDFWRHGKDGWSVWRRHSRGQRQHEPVAAPGRADSSADQVDGRPHRRQVPRPEAEELRVGEDEVQVRREHSLQAEGEAPVVQQRRPACAPGEQRGGRSARRSRRSALAVRCASRRRHAASRPPRTERRRPGSPPRKSDGGSPRPAATAAAPKVRRPGNPARRCPGSPGAVGRTPGTCRRPARPCPSLRRHPWSMTWPGCSAAARSNSMMSSESVGEPRMPNDG